MLTLANIIDQWIKENNLTHRMFYRHEFTMINNWTMDYDVLVCSCDENIRHDMIHIYDKHIELVTSQYRKTPWQLVRATDRDFFARLANILRHTCD